MKMAESFVNNRQIAKNTIVLYVRMIIVMLISLYTVRAYLAILGETDYGLYNVVGGVVAMLSFLKGTLATSSQRYLSVALVKNDKQGLRNVFCLNQTVFIIITIACVVILETVGLWFVNYKMTVPQDRMYAVNVVYQISILSFIPQMISVSYYALVIAREKMAAFAYIGIIEAVLKLGFVFVLRQVPFDKLITYTWFMFFLQVLVLAIYMVYCKRRYEESHFRFYWDKKEAVEIMGFSGWHLLGTLSVVVRSNGINLLINVFFSPIINAARAIAFQFQNAITQLTQSFFKAVIPQMYKSYANNEIKELHALIMRSTIICFFLSSLFSIPLYFNAEFVLGLWLEQTPAYALAFTQLVLINCLIDSVSDSTICPALASGKIKNFYLVTGSLYILSLPVAYVFLKLGYDATSTMWVSIAISVVALVARAYLLIELINFPAKHYFILCIKMAVATIAIGLITLLSTRLSTNNWVILIVSTFISSVLHCIIYLFFVCSEQDRNAVIRIAKSKLHIK